MSLLQEALENELRKRYGLNVLFGDKNKDPHLKGWTKWCGQDQQVDRDVKVFSDKRQDAFENYGFAVGHSGLIALDFDWPWLYPRAIDEGIGILRDTFTGQTPNGGYRVLLICPNYDKNTTKYKNTLKFEIFGKDHYAACYGRALREDGTSGEYKTLYENDMKIVKSLTELEDFLDNTLRYYDFLSYPCIAAFFEKHKKRVHLAHEQRLAICNLMSQRGITVNESQRFFMICPDYDEAISRQQCEYTKAKIDKEGLRPPTCATLKGVFGYDGSKCKNCLRKKNKEDQTSQNGKKASFKKLEEIVETEVKAEFGDCKVVLIDTSIEIYFDKECEREKVQIKDLRRKERFVLYCTERSTPPHMVSEEYIFKVSSGEEPWNVPAKRNELAKYLADYELVKADTRGEVLRQARVLVDKFYKELISRRDAQQKALREYLSLEKGVEYGDEINENAFELVKDPAFFYKFGKALEKGFFLPEIGRIRYVVGEEDTKRLLGIHVAAAPFMDTLNFVFGGYATVKDTMLKMIFRLTGARVMGRGYLTAAGLRYSKNVDEAEVLYLPEADLSGEKGRQMRLMRSDDGGFEFEYAYQDKKTGLMTTEKSKVKVKTIFITTNDLTFDEALESGGWLFQTDDSQTLTQQVIPEKLCGYVEEREILSEEQIRVWNRAFDILGRNTDIPKFVRIPYAPNLEALFDTHKSTSRRSPDKVCELIQKIAILRRYQKPVEIRDIADVIDLFIALRVGRGAITETISELTSKEREVYEAVRVIEVENTVDSLRANDEERKEIPNGVTVKQISEKLPYPHDTCYRLAESITTKGFFTKSGGRGKLNQYFLKEELTDGSKIGKVRFPNSQDPKEVLEGCMKLVYGENNIVTSDGGLKVCEKKSELKYENIEIVDPITGTKQKIIIPLRGHSEVKTSKNDENETTEDVKDEISEDKIGIRSKPNLEKPDEEREKEIKDLEELYKEQYQFKGIGNCPKCGNERGLFENPKIRGEKLCVNCFQKKIKEDFKKSVESFSVNEDDCDGFEGYTDVQPLTEPQDGFCERCEEYEKLAFKAEKGGHVVYLCDTEGRALDRHLYGNDGRFGG